MQNMLLARRSGSDRAYFQVKLHTCKLEASVKSPPLRSVAVGPRTGVLIMEVPSLDLYARAKLECGRALRKTVSYFSSFLIAFLFRLHKTSTTSAGAGTYSPCYCIIRLAPAHEPLLSSPRAPGQS